MQTMNALNDGLTAALQIDNQSGQADDATARRAASPVAMQMGKALAGMLKSFQTMGMTRDEAFAQMKDRPEGFEEWVANQPASETTWFDLERLAEVAPAAAAERWETIQQVAREELSTGHRAGLTLEAASDNCWQRAQYLALKHELEEAWNPQNGLERQLIDTMAMAQSNVYLWQTRMTTRVALEKVEERSNEGLGWVSPRLSDAEAMEQAMQFLDRWNRIFLRSLRSLRDLRRFSTTPVVVLRKGAQLNVAAAQQINVTRGKKTKAPAKKSTRKRVTPAAVTDTTTPTGTTAGTTPDNSTTTATHTKGSK